MPFLKAWYSDNKVDKGLKNEKKIYEWLELIKDCGIWKKYMNNRINEKLKNKVYK